MKAGGQPEPVFEVDEGWFSEDERAHHDHRSQQREWAAEMGIQEAELPEDDLDQYESDPSEEFDDDFGLNDETSVAQPGSRRSSGSRSGSPGGGKAPGSRLPASVADDFAALLAFEAASATRPGSSSATPDGIPLTDSMLDQMAERVAVRLNSISFGHHLREAMTSTVRDTVRAVVSETSERLVRDEIARVRAKAERHAP